MSTTIYIKEATMKEPIQTLEAILSQMDGIERALIDVDDGEIKIEYNQNELTQEQIITKIQQHGLHVLT